MADLVVSGALFVVGLLALLLAADRFTDAAQKVGVSLGFSPFIIGMTIVAAGTSFPELVAATLASIQGEPGIVVGNARKFVQGGGLANMEDGLFDVAVVELMPPAGLVAEAISDRLLGENSESVTHFRASEVRIRETSDQPITFSRDGELAEHEQLTLAVRERALDIRVGDTYDPDPP